MARATRDWWYSDCEAEAWSFKFRLLCILLAVIACCVALLVLRDVLEYPVDQKHDMAVTGIAIPFNAPPEKNRPPGEE